MVAIKTINLSKKYKDKTVVQDVNLEINEGELFSLLGVNGAGKTTMIKMLSCLIKPYSGDALLMGKSILNETQGVKEITNISPQETAIASNLTVKENLELIAKIYGNKEAEVKNKVNQIIKEFDLDEYIKAKAKTLSGGWQRRLSIAMALISEPKILFLDEPTLGLDVLARRELWKTIEKLKGKITIVLTTHYLEEVEALSDRVAIMVKGKLKAIGTVKELLESNPEYKNFEDAFVDIASTDGE